MGNGFDSAQPPTETVAKELKAKYDLTWWGMYVGGKCSGGGGWTLAEVEMLGRLGFEFLPIYVGQQLAKLCGGRGPDFSHGSADADDCAIQMQRFGWHPNTHTPVALDIEPATYFAEPGPVIAYALAWCARMRYHGYVPGVYSTPYLLVKLWDSPERPTWVYVASWYGSGFVAGRNPNAIPGFPATIWNQGDRVWQYSGGFDPLGDGFQVDADVANIVMARAPGGAPAPPAPAPAPTPTPMQIGLNTLRADLMHLYELAHIRWPG